MRKIASMLTGAALAVCGWGTAAHAHTIEIQITSHSGSTYGFNLILTPGNGLNVAPTGYESGFILPDVAATSVTLTGTSYSSVSDWTLSTTDTTGAATLDHVSNALDTTFVTGKVGSTHPIVGAADDSTIADLVLKYKGSGLASNLPTDSGRVLLTGTFDSSVSLAFLASDVALSRNSTGSGATVAASVDTFAPIISVPVPATADMGLTLLAGFGGLGLLRRFRKTRVA